MHNHQKKLEMLHVMRAIFTDNPSLISSRAPEIIFITVRRMLDTHRDQPELCAELLDFFVLATAQMHGPKQARQFTAPCRLRAVLWTVAEKQRVRGGGAK